MNPINQFGAAVRKRRKFLGWSQEKLAETAALHRTYVSRVERGITNPTLSIIVQLARGLNVKPADLFKGIK